MFLQTAVLEGVEVDHLVTLIPPDLSVDHLPVPGCQGHPGHDPRTQGARVPGETRPRAPHTGRDQVQVTEPRLLARPQELDLLLVSDVNTEL